MFNFFKKRKQPQNLKEALLEIEKLKKRIAENSEKIKENQKNIQLTIQKIAITRYSPFKETGGDQSFSIALLDKNDNGLVLTSIYSRERNRLFAKPIKNSQSKHKLSKEEIKTIEKAKDK